MAGSPGIVTGCRALPRPAESTSATLQMEQERERRIKEREAAAGSAIAPPKINMTNVPVVN